MRWTLKPLPNPEKVQQLQKALGVEKAIAHLLVQRGIEATIGYPIPRRLI